LPQAVQGMIRSTATGAGLGSYNGNSHGIYDKTMRSTSSNAFLEEAFFTDQGDKLDVLFKSKSFNLSASPSFHSISLYIFLDPMPSAQTFIQIDSTTSVKTF